MVAKVRHVCCPMPSPRYRVVEEEKNINEKGHVEYEGEKGHTD